jgi:PAS domain S-box-containing protein
MDPVAEQLRAALDEARRRIALLEEDARVLELTFDQSPVGVVTTGADFSFTRVNAAFCTMTGYSADELCTMGFPDITHPDDVDADKAGILRVIAGELGQYTREKRYIRKDGSVRWADIVVRPVRDEGGDLLCNVAIVVETTERHQAVEALRASEERYRTVVEASHEGIILQSRDGTILTWNKAAQELLGPAEEEVVGRSAVDREWHTVHEDGSPWPASDHPTMRAMSTGGPVQDLLLGLRRGEEQRWLNANAQPLWAEGDDVPVAAVVSFADVTEQRRALEELRESEQRYRVVVERANDGIVIVDDEQVIFANEAFANMTGYGQDELIGLPLVDLVQMEDRAAVAEGVRRRIAGHAGPATYEIDVVGKDGRVVSVEVSAGPISLQGQAADLAVVRDVGERRRILAAMRELNAMRDTTERVAHVGSWRYDLASDVVSWSPETYRLYDVDADGFHGDFRPVLESRVHPDDRAAVAGDIARYEGADRPGPLEYRVVHRDGSVHILHGQGTLESDDRGSPVAFIGFCQDVTDQREAERSLREAEQRFRSLFEESPVAMWYEDASDLLAWLHGLAAQGVSDLVAHLSGDPVRIAEVGDLVRVVAVNRASLDVFGAATAEEMARCFRDTFTEDTYPTLLRAVLAFAQGAPTFTARCGFQRFDGSPLTLDVSLSLVGGGTLGRDHVLASFIDVTEQVRAANEILRLNAELEQRVVSRTEQLDAATRELEALAYSMAHDVRAPLRTIDGFSAILMEEEAGSLSAESLGNLRRVRNAAQTLAGLLDDLTGLSTVSRHDLARQRVDVSALAADVADDLRAEHAARLVEVVVEPGLAAVADPHLLRLVLYELLDNAWKFTAPRRHAHVRVGAVDDGGERAFYVGDDGVGFDMAYAMHLFGAFQRMHPPGEFAGNGIGLATVQRLVRRHGGRVWAQSEVGEGATFFFTLPPARDG